MAHPESAEKRDLRLFLLLGVRCEVPPVVHSLFSVLCMVMSAVGSRTTATGQDAPSHRASSSAFRFFAFTSSSFFRASRPSFARFILTALKQRQRLGQCVQMLHITHFRRLTSSSMRNSFDFARSCCRHVGVRFLSLGSSSRVVVGRPRFFSSTTRAWLMTASSSSRLVLSERSDSA